MKTASAKAKGRRLAQRMKEEILKAFSQLQPDDIMVTPSGMTGPDLALSPKAQIIFPFAVESKNQESINVWKAVAQAKRHSMRDNEDGAIKPMLVFARNRQEPWVAVDLETFMKVYSKAFQECQTVDVPLTVS